MSKDGPLEAKPSFLAQPFYLATKVVLAFPVATIAIAIGLGVLSVAYTATNLGYKTSRLDLLNPNSDYNRLWIQYIDEFGDEDDAVVVVEGTGREQVVPVLEEVSTALAREDRLFHAVLHEVDLGKIRSKGLHYLSPEELKAVDDFLLQAAPIVAGDWSRLNLVNMLSGVAQRMEATAKAPPAEQAAAAQQGLEELERLTGSLWESLGRQQKYQSPWPQMPQAFATLSELNSQYMLTKEGRLGFVLLKMTREKNTFTRGTEATDALRALIAQVQARHPDTKIGVTGLPIMENDEMRSSQESMTWASLLSLLAVVVLVIAGFGGLRHALLANLVLLLGMAWSFGYVTLAVGHLNILSASFTVTLIGLGIDYGIHYVSRYIQLRNAGMSCEEALLTSSRDISPAITTGALTTAVAFFAAAFTSFTGIAEMGIIAGGGILLCGVAELFVLPACILLVDRAAVFQKMPTPLAVHKWIAPVLRWPRVSIALTVGLTLVLSFGITRLWYDHNLLNMQAEGLESVKLEKRLLAECNQSVWYALSIADSREELLARKAEFLKLPTVERTEEIVSLLPVDHEIKQPLIARIQDRLSALPERPSLIPVDRPDQLGQVLGRMQDLLLHSPHGEKAVRHIELTRDLLRRTPLSECYAQLSRFQQQMAGDLLSRMYALRNVANPEPPELADLPASLVDRFVGQHGRHLLKIYGRGNIWDTTALEKFVKDVRTVDAKVTGNPLQAYEAALEMKKSYFEAALYALVVIVAVLLFDFRDWRYALIAILPLGIGLLQTYGILGLLDIPLNPANLIALPMILGFAIDYGVHIVHEFRDSRGPYRMTSATAIAVLIDGLTTMVGFGAMIIASHQGLQSLGRVLTIAVTCCMFTSMVMLPAVLAWFTRNRPEVGDEEVADVETQVDAGLIEPVQRLAA